MKVLIYGGGAVGSIFGWRIAQRSHARVSVICRSNWQRVHEAGYYLRTHAWGAGHFMPYQVYMAGSLIQLPPNHRFDYIVCANKNTGDCTYILRDLSTLVHSDTTLVAAQNGMDVELPLQEAFPRNTVLSAICNVGCSQVSSGFIEQTTHIKRPAFLIGVHGRNYRQSEIDAAKRDVLVSMDSQFAGVDCANRERWLKLIFNSAINSTTALTGLNAQQLLEQPGAEELVAKLANEAYRVGVASGIELDPGLPSKTLELARSCGPLTPSTLQDVQNRKPLELSPIFGYLVSQAAKVGTPIPYMTWIYSLLRQRSRIFVAEKGARKASWHNSHLVDELPISMASSGSSIEAM